MTQQQLSQILGSKVIGYSNYGKPIMSVYLGEGVSIEIELENEKMPVTLDRPMQEAADYIATRFFAALHMDNQS